MNNDNKKKIIIIALIILLILLCIFIVKIKEKYKENKFASQLVELYDNNKVVLWTKFFLAIKCILILHEKKNNSC